MPRTRLCLSTLEREQAQDLRRSVLCGELNWDRELVADGFDAGATVALALEGEKPVATGRLIERTGRWWLDLVAVLPKQRRLGFGRELVDFLAVSAGAKGVQDLWVLTPAGSAPFFQACGFIEDRSDTVVWLLHRKLG
jgi:N-acetylglutamate synthase-like GNAT family acetyltransferase